MEKPRAESRRVEGIPLSSVSGRTDRQQAGWRGARR